MNRMTNCDDRCCGACPACIGPAAYDDGRETEYEVVFWRDQKQAVRVSALDEDRAKRRARELLAEDKWETLDEEIETKEIE